MSAEAKQFSPELIHLLSEILVDPAAVFRQLSHMRASALWERSVAVDTPFLFTTERQILARHRAEVARLLCEGCMLTLQDAPVARSRVFFRRDVVAREDWLRDVRKVFRAPAHRMPEERERLRGVGRRGGLGAREAELSLALSPSPEAHFARVCLLRLEGRLEEAILAGCQWLQSEASPRWRGAARRGIAEASLDLGNREAALNWYRESALGRVPDRTAAVSWMIQALVLGLEDDVKSSLAYVEASAERFEPVRTGYFRAIGKHALRSLGVETSVLDDAKGEAQRLGFPYAAGVLDALT